MEIEESSLPLSHSACEQREAVYSLAFYYLAYIYLTNNYLYLLIRSYVTAYPGQACGNTSIEIENYLLSLTTLPL